MYKLAKKYYLCEKEDEEDVNASLLVPIFVMSKN